MNGLLELGNDVRVGPEIVAGLAEPSRVFGAATHPWPVIDERDDNPNTDTIGRRQNFVERAKGFFVEFSRRQDVAGDCWRVVRALQL